MSVLAKPQIRKIFCMNRECFDLLSQRIITSIGESKFKSEVCIDAFLKGKYNMYDANVKTTGGYISGEVKLGVTLRLLTRSMPLIWVSYSILLQRRVTIFCMKLYSIGLSTRALEISI